MAEVIDGITVNYKTKKFYCHCCEQKLPEAKISEDRDFRFSKSGFMEYADWKLIMEDDDEFDVIVDEYVHETIGFFATSIVDKIIIDKDEIRKVKDYIKTEITKES